ncbi:hypothetical protein [Cellulomonas sp. Root137]|uniref:hypothetical protein n=1 Tax=Cellulomonas sp. Root137 TaxID=1736459 RepID=UPI000AC4A297|nr:hypothetical protein [Cellulomonas sp. Root137]
MATDHRARQRPNVPAGPRTSADEPLSTSGIALRGALVVGGLYLVWLGAHGSPFPGTFGGDDRNAWILAGPGAWTAQSVVVLAAGVLAVLFGAAGLLSAAPFGGTAFRARLRARNDLILFALCGVLFTAALVALAVLWSSGVAFRTYEVDDSPAGGAMYGILIGVCAIVAGVGWAMVVTFVRGPARTLLPNENLPTGRLLLRPFGYLALGIVWLALWLVILAVAAALPVALSDRDPIGLADVPLSQSVGVVDLQENPLKLVAVVVLLVPVLAAIFGWVVVMFPLTAWPLAALSFVYVARSLRPSFAGEALSATSSTDEAVGQPTATETALSLLPVRSSRLTDLLTTAYLAGWTPSFAMIRSCFWLGLGYVLFTVWIAWPVTDVTLVVLFSAISLGLAGYTVFRLVGLARAVPTRPVRPRARKA